MKRSLRFIVLMAVIGVVLGGCSELQDGTESSYCEEANRVDETNRDATDTDSNDDDKAEYASTAERTNTRDLLIKPFEFSKDVAVIDVERQLSDFTPFVELSLTPMQEFQFGDYMLIVRYSIDILTAEVIPLYAHALLGEGIGCLEQGRTALGGLMRDLGIANDYAEIVFISQDGRRIAVYHRIYDLEDVFPWWRGQTDIFEDNELIFSFLRDDENLFRSWPNLMFDLDGFFIEHSEVMCADRFLTSGNLLIDFNNNVVYELEYIHGNMLWIPNNTNSILTFQRCLLDTDIMEIRIFNIHDMNLNYIVQLPVNARVNQFIDGQYLVITFDDFAPESNRFENPGFYSHTYLFNIATHEMQFLGNYMFNPVVSPDKRFVAFTNPNGRGSHEFMCELNNLSSMQSGFYIKDLETGMIVFYPIAGIEFAYGVVGWVSSDILP